MPDDFLNLIKMLKESEQMDLDPMVKFFAQTNIRAAIAASKLKSWKTIRIV